MCVCGEGGNEEGGVKNCVRLYVRWRMRSWFLLAESVRYDAHAEEPKEGHTQKPHHKYHSTGSQNYERHNLSLAGRDNEVKMPSGSPIVCRAGSGCQVDSPTYNYKLHTVPLDFRDICLCGQRGLLSWFLDSRRTAAGPVVLCAVHNYDCVEPGAAPLPHGYPLRPKPAAKKRAMSKTVKRSLKVAHHSCGCNMLWRHDWANMSSSKADNATVLPISQRGASPEGHVEGLEVYDSSHLGEGLMRRLFAVC